MIVDLDHEGKVPIAFWRIEMKSSTGRLIKVAEGDQLPVTMDVPVSGGNTVRVAEGAAESDGTSPVIKYADRLVPPEDQGYQVVEDNNFAVEEVRPEDQDLRRVECTITIRDILGNETKEKIVDLQSVIDKKEAKEQQKDESLPVWLEEF